MKDVKLDGLSREDWLEIRKRGLGGSDICAIMRESPWTTPYDVFLDKTGQSVPIEDNPRMRAGRFLEGAVAEMFKDDNPELQVRADTHMRFDKKYPFLYANTDRLVMDADGNVGVLEIKTTSSWYSRTWDADVPYQYYVQLQHYLGVLDRSFGYIAILIDGWDYRCFRFERDETLVDEINRTAVNFWKNNVLAKVPPEPMTDEDLKRLYPEEEKGKSVDGDILDISVAEDYLEAKENEAMHLKKKKELALKLKSRIGDAECLMYGNEVLATYKKNAKGSRVLNVKRIGE